MTQSARWTERRERGSVVLLRIAFWIVHVAGWHAGHALLYPITLYFYIASPSLRAVSRDYLGRVLDRPVRNADVMRHIFTFASVLLDRIFFLGGRTDGYELNAQGVDLLEAQLDLGRGCVLLGAHIGSFDMLRAFGRAAPVPVNPLMFRSTGGVFTRLIESIDPELARRVIDIGQPGAMLRVQECVSRGEIVGILGDRFTGPQRVAEIPFLGDAAPFPTGPLALAAVLHAPVMLCYGVRTGPRRYHVRFEPFSSGIELRRATRQQDLRHWLERYATSVAAICREHPYNWFNFYPFWQAVPGNAGDA